MKDVVEKKKAWRRLVKEMFALIDPDARRRLDAVLAERVRELVFRSGAGVVLGYAAMPDEPDLSPFFRRWVAEGGRLALPVWMGGQRMLYRRVSDWEAHLRPGRAGIMEPVDGLPEVAPAELELVVVPGRAFSEGCARLGRGAGCYDALFRETKAVRMGAAYDFQVFPEIATDAGDEPLHMVVTPTRMVGKDTL